MRTRLMLIATVSLLASTTLIVACSDSHSPSVSGMDPDRELDPHVEASSAEPSDALIAVSTGADGVEITADNVYDHEEFWPNIVTMAADWMPPEGAPKRPQTLQGALIRVERDGRVRVDLARFGRADVTIEETDLVERANAVRRGELFKHRGNFTMQIGTRLVSSKEDRPAPQPSRPIKSAETLLCVFADPRSPEFEPLASELDRLAEDQDLQMILIPQNVLRDDRSLVHSTLRKFQWEVPFTDPVQSPSQTTTLLREKPDSSHALLVTREGRVLLDMPLDGVTAFAAIREAISGDELQTAEN